MFGWLFFMSSGIDIIVAKLVTVLNPDAYSFIALSQAIAKYGVVEKVVLITIITIIFIIMVMEYLSISQNKNRYYSYLIEGAVPYLLLFLTFILPARSFARFVYFNF